MGGVGFYTQSDNKQGTAMIPRLLTPRETEGALTSVRHLNSNRQKAESRYHTLINADSTGVYTCDAIGVITYYNNRAAELWGRQPAVGDTDERFCGAHLLYRVDGSFMPHEKCPMSDVLAGRVSGVYDAEVQVERPDGSRIVVIVNIAPLIDDKGAIVGAVNSFFERALRERVNGSRDASFP